MRKETLSTLIVLMLLSSSIVVDGVIAEPPPPTGLPESCNSASFDAVACITAIVSLGAADVVSSNYQHAIAICTGHGCGLALQTACEANPTCSGAAGVSASGGADGTDRAPVPAPSTAPPDIPLRTVADLSSGWGGVGCNPLRQNAQCFSPAFLKNCATINQCFSPDFLVRCAAEPSCNSIMNTLDPNTFLTNLADKEYTVPGTTESHNFLTEAFASFHTACLATKGASAAKCDPLLSDKYSVIDTNDDGVLEVVGGCVNKWSVPCHTGKDKAEKYKLFKEKMRSTLDVQTIAQGVGLVEAIEEALIFITPLEPGWDRDELWFAELEEFFGGDGAGSFFSGRWEESICAAGLSDYATSHGVVLSSGGSYGANVNGAKAKNKVFDEETGRLKDVTMYLLTMSLTPTGFTQNSKDYLTNPEDCTDSIQFRIQISSDTDNTRTQTAPPNDADSYRLNCNSAPLQHRAFFTSTYTGEYDEVCIIFENADEFAPRVKGQLTSVPGQSGGETTYKLCADIVEFGSAADLGCDTIGLSGFEETVGEILTAGYLPELDCSAYGVETGGDDSGVSQQGENRPGQLFENEE